MNYAYAFSDNTYKCCHSMLSKIGNLNATIYRATEILMIAGILFPTPLFPFVNIFLLNNYYPP